MKIVLDQEYKTPIFKTSPIIFISSICFHLHRVKNCNKDSSMVTHFKSSKTIRVSYLDLEVSIFVKMREFYLVTQSLKVRRTRMTCHVRLF